MIARFVRWNFRCIPHAIPSNLELADLFPLVPITSADLEACKALFKPLWTMQHLQLIDFGRFQKLASWRNMNEEGFWAGLADLVQQLWPPGETASPRCVLAMTDLLRKISEETPRHLAQQALGHPLVFAVMTPKQRAEIAFHFCTQVPSFLDLLLARNIDLCFLTASHGILYRGHMPLLYTIAHWIQSESSFRALLLDRNCALPDGKQVSAIQYSLKLHPGFQFSSYMSLYTAIATSQHPRVIPLLELLNQHREAIIQDSQDPHIVGNPSDTDISGLSIFDRPRAIPMDFALTHYFLKEGVPGNAKLLVEHIMQPRITRLILERSPRVLLAKANYSQQSAFIVILKALCLQLKMAIINSVGVILDCMDRDEALKQECLTDEAISLIATSFKMLVGNARDDLRKQSGILRRLYSVLDHQRLLFVAKGSILASQAAFMGWELSKFEDALPDENSIFYLISDACCELELANLNLQKPSLLVPPGKLTAPPARNASRQTDHDDSYSYNAHYNKGFAGISKNSVHVLILRIFQIMSKSARFPEVIAAWNKHGVPVLHACITFSGAGLGQEVSESYFQIRSATAKLLVAAGIDTDMKDYTGHRALEYGSYEEKASWIRILRPETEAVSASESSSTK
jgi:hypothetical protein